VFANVSAPSYDGDSNNCFKVGIWNYEDEPDLECAHDANAYNCIGVVDADDTAYAFDSRYTYALMHLSFDTAGMYQYVVAQVLPEDYTSSGYEWRYVDYSTEVVILTFDVQDDGNDGLRIDVTEAVVDQNGGGLYSAQYGPYTVDSEGNVRQYDYSTDGWEVCDGVHVGDFANGRYVCLNVELYDGATGEDVFSVDSSFMTLEQWGDPIKAVEDPSANMYVFPSLAGDETMPFTLSFSAAPSDEYDIPEGSWTIYLETYSKNLQNSGRIVANNGATVLELAGDGGSNNDFYLRIPIYKKGYVPPTEENVPPLPSAGGYGAWPYFAIGATSVLFGAALLYGCKKRKNKGVSVL
jgi:LPXTG-motif cell wall-anchored protein